VSSAIQWQTAEVQRILGSAPDGKFIEPGTNIVSCYSFRFEFIIVFFDLKNNNNNNRERIDLQRETAAISFSCQ
jgi:hypothetical protein